MAHGLGQVDVEFVLELWGCRNGSGTRVVGMRGAVSRVLVQCAGGGIRRKGTQRDGAWWGQMLTRVFLSWFHIKSLFLMMTVCRIGEDLFVVTGGSVAEGGANVGG
jgi:hypothetical protein